MVLNVVGSNPTSHPKDLQKEIFFYCVKFLKEVYWVEEYFFNKYFVMIY